MYPLPLEGMTEADVAAELSVIAAQHDRLYVLYWGDAQQDPQRWVERWLDEHTFKATDEWVKDVRFVVYAVPAEPAAAMETAVSIPFGPSITLQGYTLGQTTLAPGDIAQVTLFWQTAVPLAARYKIFLHLVDETGNLVAQRDSEPGGNLKPTTIWPPGEVISDHHGLLLPADLPPGEYTLLLGLYDDAGVLHHVGVAASFTMKRRRELVEELAPLREGALEGHPWASWQGGDGEAPSTSTSTSGEHEHERKPGMRSRWNANKDLTWEPPVSYTHLRAHETVLDLVCRLLLEKKQ